MARPPHLQEGPDAARIAWIRQQQAALWRYLCLLGARPGEVEDVMQDAFVALFRAYAAEPAASQVRLLRTIARRRLFELRRRRDLLLAECLGKTSAPDVSDVVAARLAGEPRSGRRHPYRALLQAACLLLGVIVVVGIYRLGDVDPGPVVQQPPLGPVVTVTSLAEIEALSANADNVRLELHTADAVRALTRLRGLRRLDASFEARASVRPRAIERPAFFPDAARWLGMLTSLEQLDISGHAPIRGLDRLVTLDRLRSLRIDYAFLDPAKGIVELGLGGYERVTDDVLASVARMPALRRLSLCICSRVTDEGMRALSETALESFSMNVAQTLSDVGVAHLPRSLRRLDVHESDFGPLAFARFDQLSELSLTIYPGGFRPLGEELASSAMRGSLRKLTLDGGLGQFGDLAPLARLPALQQLDLYECVGKLPEDLLTQLRARGVEVRLPRLSEPEVEEVMESEEISNLPPNPGTAPNGGR